MSSSANVRSTEALEGLRSALMRFKHEAQSALNAADGEINHTRAWLQERLQYWQNELKRRRHKLEEAQAALRACEYRAREGRTPDCSAQQAAVRWAMQQVHEAEQELRIVQGYMRRVEEAIARYQRQARRLSETLDNELLKGSELLRTSVSILLSYASGSIEGASSLDVSAPLQSPTSASTSFPTATPTSSSTSFSYGVAPHLGIQMISLDQINMSDSWVTGSEDFRKDSDPEALKEAFRKLQEVVIPAVAKGSDADYFAQLDASLGLQNADSYLNVYNVFYGEDAIRLDLIGKQYNIINGSHRLYIARQLGIFSVPAKVDFSGT